MRVKDISLRKFMNVNKEDECDEMYIESGR